MSLSSELIAARELLDFIDSSPSPYHAVATAAARLQSAGYREFDERAAWQVSPGDRGYVRRGGALIAFELGRLPPSDGGMLLVAAHTDSPGLRVKPRPEVDSAGCRQLGMEAYGGLLLHTWLDRELGLAGRITLASGRSELVKLTSPALRIPSLAIHLDREVNSRGLVVNPQTQLAPVLGLTTSDAPTLGGLLAKELSVTLGEAVAAEDVLGWDLAAFELAPGALIGHETALISAPRLDNLASCHAALCALLAEPNTRPETRVLALYDHEEVGSETASGAGSRFLLSLLERLAMSTPTPSHDAVSRALARSLLLSVDMAHATHPHYSDKHEPQHPIFLGRGPALKLHAGQSYASDGPGIAALDAVARRAGVETQRFVTRGDIRCGSTVGPITAARLALRTVDLGMPMLGMHSCRELAACADLPPLISLLTAFYRDVVVPPPRD